MYEVPLLPIAEEFPEFSAKDVPRRARPLYGYLMAFFALVLGATTTWVAVATMQAKVDQETFNRQTAEATLRKTQDETSQLRQMFSDETRRRQEDALRKHKQYDADISRQRATDAAAIREAESKAEAARIAVEREKVNLTATQGAATRQAQRWDEQVVELRAQNKSLEERNKLLLATLSQPSSGNVIPVPKPVLVPTTQVKEPALGSRATVRKLIGPGILREFKSGRFEYADKSNALNEEVEIEVMDKKLVDSVAYYQIMKGSRGGWLTQAEVAEYLSFYTPAEDKK